MATSDPLPTPYDIAPLPHFAFEPSASTWIIFGLAALALALLALAIRYAGLRRQSPARAAQTLRSRLLSMRAQSPQANTRHTGEELSLLLRRFLASRFGASIPALSRTELEDYYLRYPEKPWADLFRAVITLEDTKYSPQPSDAATVKALIDTCLTALDLVMEEA